MNRRTSHLSRRDAERLLADPAASDSALGTVLAAAGETARPGELRREDDAVTTFHSARLTTSPASRAGFVSPTALGRRAASRAVVATGAVVALATGGLALASSTGLPLLPGPASDHATESVSGSRTPSATTSSATGPGKDSGKSSGKSSGKGSDNGPASKTPTESSTEDEGPMHTPSPNFRGLCNAFQATDHSAHGKSLDSAAFTALATEADGVTKIATYCVALIGEPKETGRPTDKPTPGRPTGTSTDQSTGKPSALPTPTDKPSPGKPTDKPTDKPAPAGKSGGKDSTTSGP